MSAWLPHACVFVSFVHNVIELAPSVLREEKVLVGPIDNLGNTGWPQGPCKAKFWYAKVEIRSVGSTLLESFLDCIVGQRSHSVHPAAR